MFFTEEIGSSRGSEGEEILGRIGRVEGGEDAVGMYYMKGK